MNRNRYRLVFNATLGMLVPVAECARRHGKAASGLALAGVLIAGAAGAELPVPGAGGAIPQFVTAGQAAYQVSGTQALVNQVGDKAILNWQSFNVSPGHSVQFQQVDSLATNNLVQGANFTSLNRIWDMNPSVIAGSLTQAAGQNANVILVNTNGIAFMGGAQVNLNSFTASSLDIRDSYILGNLLTNDSQPQYVGTGGFIKVFEGARITAGSQGRVMLLAPTVVNKGTVEAPDGQVILAAGSKVFLSAAGNSDRNVRGLLVEVDSPDEIAGFDTPNTTVRDGELDGETVVLADAADDKLGHASNLGELTTPRGNVTMIGYAVNQHGIARATTSVVANGSVYLLAKDEAINKNQATRGGRVVLGAGSLTEVLPETADATGALDGDGGQGLARRSQVRVVGQSIEMQGGAAIHAASGEVNLLALDNPGQLDSGNDPFNAFGAPVSNQARVHIANGATIDVAGLRGVQVSVARNSVEVELRGDELKDSPVNRDGPLRGEKVYLDLGRTLANSDAGKDTLIARDSLESYQGRIERTVAERSTTGGSVIVKSQGEVVLEQGARIDLSGGSLEYTPGTVKTTLLASGSQIVDLADAVATARYDGIASRRVVEDAVWNVKQTIDVGNRFDPGYVEGKDAGALSVIGMKSIALQSDIAGRTVAGARQREAGVQPKGATLTLGRDKSPTLDEYKLNQRVVVGAETPADIGALVLNPALFGDNKVAHLTVFSNQAAEVRDALRLPQGGSVAITAKGVAIHADIEAGAGDIAFNARGNSFDIAPAPLDVTVADGVTLSARGAWANDYPGVPGRSTAAAGVDGGSVTLSAAGNVDLGEGSRVDVAGGGRVRADGSLENGDGGDITLEAGAGAPTAGTHAARVTLGGELRGHALGKGGTLTVSTAKIKLGGAAEADALNLDPGFVARGGFANVRLTGRDGVEVADGVTLMPRVESLDLLSNYILQPTGSRMEAFTRVVQRDDRVRQAANLTLAADGEFGVVRIGRDARILGDDRATIALNAGKRIDIQGEVRAAGGAIAATLSRDTNLDYDPSGTIWLGVQSVLDASGAARTYLSQGRQLGSVLDGGTVNLRAASGFVVTEAGSAIRVNGAAPVRLDVPNEAGGVGRMVGSDAGTVRIAAREGALLDGTLDARAGSAQQRGGRFEFTLGDNASPLGNGYPTGERVVSVAPTVAAQATGLAPGAPMPAGATDAVRLDAGRLEAAGFDRIALKSRDVIRLEDGLDLGAGVARPLREISLDAPHLQTAGGDAALAAHTVRLGNADAERQGTLGAQPTGTGELRVDAQLLELIGTQTLDGMARAELTGEEEVRLAGVSTNAVPRPTGRLTSSADLSLRGARIVPASYTDYTLDASGQRVEFGRTAQSTQMPLSALGSLTVRARDVVQGGNLWAPFGQIDLQAADSLVFESGSLTSVAGAAGTLLPLGKIENGRAWVVDANGTRTPIDALPDKAIRARGHSVDMRAGATLDLAGGGDLQAYEFTVGPGGGSDILNRPGTYAILPNHAGGFAPRDPQEGFDRASGESVYLSGVPGLADGTYTLLPAHYALLPGAYAVRLDAGTTPPAPGQSYARQDGVRVAAGYVTDSRDAAPRDASWRGIEVMTHDQVRARSEFTLTRASDFFAEGAARPQDAGVLSIVTTGSGPDALALDATYRLGAAAGGRGAAVDLGAQKIAIVSGAPSGLDADAVRLDVDKLNALGADSLFIGGTRSRSGDTTTLTVETQSLTLANDAGHALAAPEILLAAQDTLTLRSGSAIDAQGEGGDAGRYETAGDGALLRAAATSAQFARTGSPARTQGTLVGEAGSTLAAGDSVVLDATRENAYRGDVTFGAGGGGTAGNLAIGATRVNFGAAPVGAEGLTYSQADLDALDLESLTLASYSTFDLYGDVSVGRLDAEGKPVLRALTLHGAGLAGIDNSGRTARLHAQSMTLANPAAAGFVAGGPLGDGRLAIVADTLTLGAGDKSIRGFDDVAVSANEIVGQGAGTMTIDAPVMIEVARIAGEKGARQALVSDAALSVVQRAADRALAPVTALGAQWALQGASVQFDSKVELPAGEFRVVATGGDVTLGAQAAVDVAGRSVRFFDETRPAWAGTAEFVSESGNVSFADGARVDVSAAAGGDAGTLVVQATDGTVSLADGSVVGLNPADDRNRRGEGARARIDAGTLASLSDLNDALNAGGFDGERSVRVRHGDVRLDAGESVRAQDIRIAADAGAIEIAGTLDASGAHAGRIALHARDDVSLLAGAQLAAHASDAGADGGDIEIGTRDGSLNLAAGSALDLTGGAGGRGGTLLLRAPRTVDDVAVAALGSSVTGARSVAVEAVKVYDGIATLTATGGAGSTLSLATIRADNDAWAANAAAIHARLGTTGDPVFHLLSGVEVRSSGDLALTADWNLASARAGGEPGVLTLRAAGNLALNANLSDGFNVATPMNGAAPATLLTDASWSYRLVGGADAAAADPLAVSQKGGDLTLAAGKLVRTGTGDIRMAAGGNLQLANDKSAIYTAGRLAAPMADFTQPAHAQFSEGGGDVRLAALGDIAGAPSTQLYSNWLFRQGRLNADGSSYLTRPAWWVRFDQFQQGVAALGGGNVTIAAGGRVSNVSASAPTQARMATATPDSAGLVRTGGGSVRIESGGDLLGGQYYADNGEIAIRSGGAIASGQSVGPRPLHTILALGDAQASVQARDDLNLHAILNPHLVVQSSGAGPNVNVVSAGSALWSVFSTYGEDSRAALASLAGNVNFHNAPAGSASLASMTTSTGAYKTPLNFTISSVNYNAARAFAVMPSSLEFTAFQGDVLAGGTTAVMRPAASGQLDVLAMGSASLPLTLTLSDMEPMPDALRPAVNTNAFSPTTLTAHASQPVHAGDTEPARVYAVTGDVSGAANKLNLVLAKAVRVKAGQDVRDLGISAQHANAGDVSQVEAGRDVVYTSLGSRSKNAYIWLAGPGRLEVTAGRDVDLGTSAGIVSRGNLDNAALPARGADIHVTAGVGAGGIDYAGAIDRLDTVLAANANDDTALWLARWLTGDDTLSAPDARAAVQAIAALDPEARRSRVRELVFSALRATGRASLDASSPYAADYARGYAALELVFPGIAERNDDGSFRRYRGDINLFASRVLTERGGDIEFMTPGGDVIVGLSNTPAVLLATDVPGSGVGLTDSGVLGMATVADGDLRGFARGDVLVNQSRMLTVGGGDVLLWSSEGDIDAGKGKKTATTVPPPLILVDSQGNVTQVLQGAASGSGIGALKPAGGSAGDVDLVAPKGTVNAGDAGIRAGNLNIAAQVVLGADNISVSGTSAGTPVADTSAVTAASSGASNAGGDVSSSTQALSQNLAEAARAAEELKRAFKPTFISAEVIGYGE